MTGANSAFLSRFEARPRARLRLLCFPHAGAGSSTYATWLRNLPLDVELCAVQLPGREARHRDPPIVDMLELIEQLTEALAGLHDRPLALFGHSLGALMAFEYARSMRRVGRVAPIQLLVSGAGAPQQPRGTPISHRPDAEFIDEMIRRYDGIPKLILDDRELLEYFVPVLRSDLKLLESYRYAEEPPLTCPINAFGGRADPRISEAELKRWASHTTGRFEFKMFAGGHFFVASEREAFLTALNTQLRVHGLAS